MRSFISSSAAQCPISKTRKKITRKFTTQCSGHLSRVRQNPLYIYIYICSSQCVITCSHVGSPHGYYKWRIEFGSSAINLRYFNLLWCFHGVYYAHIHRIQSNFFFENIISILRTLSSNINALRKKHHYQFNGKKSKRKFWRSVLALKL